MTRRTCIAFDFGTKSIGVAIGHCFSISGIVNPIGSLKSKNFIPNWNLIQHLIKEWNPDEVIVGLPLNMDGTEQLITCLARKFANEIQNRFDVVVKLHDERLSTAEARSQLFEYGGFRALSKKNVDSVSAMIILKSYFNQEI